MSRGAKFFNNNLQLLMKKKTKYVSDVKKIIFCSCFPKECQKKYLLNIQPETSPQMHTPWNSNIFIYERILILKKKK